MSLKKFLANFISKTKDPKLRVRKIKEKKATIGAKRPPTNDRAVSSFKYARLEVVYFPDLEMKN